MRLRQQKRALLAASGLWLAFGVTQWVLWMAQHPSASAAVRSGAHAALLGRPLLWIAFTPLIWHIAHRADLRTGPRAAKAMLHVVTALIFAAIDAALYAALWRRFGQEPIALPYTGYLGSLVNGSVYLYTVVLVAVYGIEWSSRIGAERLRASRLRTALTTSQLHALTLQLHPHFLFNSLNSVSELVHRSPATAASMLIHLRELLRQSLEIAPDGLVAFRDELAFVRHYLELQQTRFPELSFNIDVAEDTLDLGVPHFLLQPIVENAIRHGLTPKGGSGTITIRAWSESGQLRIEVLDDGIGLTNRAVAEGIGLRNVRERVENLFDTQGQFALQSNHGVGAIARIRLAARIYEPQPVISEASGAHATNALQWTTTLVWRTIALGAVFLFLVAAAKELLFFDILQQPPRTILHWIAMDAFSSFAWIPAGVIVALAAYRAAVTEEHRGRWFGTVALILVTAPVFLLIIRDRLGLVYGSEFQLVSIRAVYWLMQDLSLFIVVAVGAFAAGVHRRWRNTEVAAAELLEKLNSARLSLLRRKVEPAALLPILDKLAEVTTRSPEMTDYLTGRVGELLRHMLEDGQRDVIDLAEEIRDLETLMEMEKCP